MKGIRVLDVGSMYAGPVVATFLADMGADVIKVEPPQGDSLRHFPFSWPMEGRGKRSVTLNLRRPEGQELLRKLAASADVLVENFTVGTLDQLGLGPDKLHAINPRLVYVRVTGYGQVGPYRDRRAMDPVGLAFGGVSHLLRSRDGVPQLTGNLFFVDYLAALLGAFGTAEALRRRDAHPDGKGEVVDVAMYDMLLRITGSEVINSTLAAARGEQVPELGTVPAPWGPFRAQDGTWVTICVVPYSEMWARLVEATDADWARDSAGRARGELQYEDKELVDTKIGEWVAARSAQDVVATLSSHGVPAAICMTPPMLVEDEHLAAVGAYETHRSPEGLEFMMPAPVPQIGSTRPRTQRPAPQVGEHNEEVYGEALGLTKDAVAELRELGVI
ncbi:CaiB/BaiF CoA transferase family protein [Nocardia sp. NPDC004278]